MNSNSRILTIKELYQHRHASPNIVVPQILLSGVWLMEAGFDSPESVIISVKRNKLIIQKSNEQLLKENVRKLKIVDAYVQREKGYRRVPKIVLSGLWLEAANFRCREKIRVDVGTKKIIIRKGHPIKNTFLYSIPHHSEVFKQYI